MREIIFFLLIPVSLILLKAFIIPRLNSYRCRDKIILASLSFISGLALVFVIPVNIPESARLISKAAGYIGMTLFFLVCILSVSLLLLRINLKDSTDHTKKAHIIFFLFFLPCAIVWTVYLLAFYPGMMSPDSIEQWRQLATFQLEDWQPAFHALFNWLLTRIWFSPAVIGIFQILFLSSVFALGMVKLYGNNVPLPILIGATIFYSVLPINGAYVITLWKDIPYSISLLWLTVIMINIVKSNGKWLSSCKNMTVLMVVLSLIILFRHNGILPAFGTVIGMLICLRDKWKNIVLVSLVTILIVFLVKVPLYRALNVITGPPVQIFFLLSYEISAVINADGKIEDNERLFLNEILPWASWKNNYYKYSVDRLVYDLKNPFNTSFVFSHRKEFFEIWINIVSRNPLVVLEHHLWCASLIWKICQPPDGYTYAIHNGIDKNPFGLQTSSILPDAEKFIKNIIRKTSKPVLIWFFFRPAIYLYISIYFCFLLIYRNGNIKELLVICPLIFNSLGMLLTIPAQDVRYMYSAILIAPLMVSYFFHRPQEGRNNLWAAKMSRS